MAKKKKVIPFVRDRKVNANAPYPEKFADFLKTIEQAKATGCEAIIIAEPWVIGDTYDEIMESLARLSGTGISLEIVMAKNMPWNN